MNCDDVKNAVDGQICIDDDLGKMYYSEYYGQFMQSPESGFVREGVSVRPEKGFFEKYKTLLIILGILLLVWVFLSKK